ncbi:MAG TPA: DUF5947 family protein [Tepidisphaeraceae bacterium]|jgi:hypothetical protein|nr:DUF5947 family protein [Tepidisphaeraceae bacterium]
MNNAPQPPEVPQAARGAIEALRRFSRPRVTGERCDLCAAPLAPDHQHLLEPANRKLVCSCDACAILFSDTASRKYRRVPRRVELLDDFQMTDLQWEAFGIPISLAFFFYSSPNEQMLSVYPSPAGGTEAIIPADAWQLLAAENPVLDLLEPDVEALLVNRMNGARDYHRVPIDECYRLVGLIKTHWRGLSGGAEVWKHFTIFFQELKAKSAGVSSHA